MNKAKGIFVSANSHRAAGKLRGKFPEVISHYRMFTSKNKGPHYAYLITAEQFIELKNNPIKGCGKLRHQDESEWCRCIKFS